MKQFEYTGAGSIKNIPLILKELKSENIFLVRGKKSFEISGAENILSEMLSNYSVNYFMEFSGDPKLTDVIKGMDSLLESGCDTILAVGGGSVIDMAKSVNILSLQDGNPESVLKGDTKILRNGKPLIAVPTTSGAGSESTHFAVVYSGDEKYSLAHEFILPEYSITDPELTYNLPKEVTAVSGMDAFSQAVESYWNINSNEESRSYSSDAIRLILKNLPDAVNNPTKEARLNMSVAAHLSGKAINITKTTAPHAVSYIMTSHFGIPHGQAVCLTLGEFLDFNYNVTEQDTNGEKNFTDIRNNIDELIKTAGCQDIKEFKNKIRELILSAGLKTRLSELNIESEENINFIADKVNTERLKNNPRIVSKESIKKILGSIS